MTAFARYVAIGDSSTYGLDDRDGRGSHRGWASRLADIIAGIQGSLLYANLGVPGLRTREILDTQLAPALAMRPDLATLFCGTNDVTARGFNAASVAADVARMQGALVEQGATVLTFTLPDLTPVMPLARPLAPRVRALNDALRAASAASGATLVDVAAHPVATDPRLWGPDRIHANAEGHARIAAALAWALGLPGTDRAWAEDLPPAPPPSLARRCADEATWMWRYLLPWAWQQVRGATPLAARRPTLEPVIVPR